MTVRYRKHALRDQLRLAAEAHLRDRGMILMCVVGLRDAIDTETQQRDRIAALATQVDALTRSLVLARRPWWQRWVDYLRRVGG